MHRWWRSGYSASRPEAEAATRLYLADSDRPVPVNHAAQPVQTGLMILEKNNGFDGGA